MQPTRLTLDLQKAFVMIHMRAVRERAFADLAEKNSRRALLPCHPHIRDEETFTSWLVHTAAANGVTLKELCSWLGIERYFETVDDPYRFSDERALRHVETLSAATGVPVERICQSLTSQVPCLWVTSFEFRDRPYNRPNAWVTQHVDQTARSYVGEFCWQCLQTESYFRLPWRISLFVACDDHKCLFSYRCASCGAHFAGFRHLLSVNLSTRNVLLECPSCSVPLTTQSQVSSAHPVVTRLQRLGKHMIANGSCLPFFHVLHRILSMLLRNRVLDRMRSPAPLLSGMDAVPPLFELCTPAERQYLLLEACELFQDWPRAFVDTVRRYRAPLPSTNAITPAWFACVLDMVRRSGCYSIEEVREYFWSSAHDEGWQDAAEFLIGAPPQALVAA